MSGKDAVIHKKERKQRMSGKDTAIHPEATVDVTDVVCPITFVKAKIAIEALAPGQVLELKLNEGEALRNVPHSLKDEGHRVTSVKNNEDGTFTLFVEKDGLAEGSL
jgi:TusA-related sulfurtransferase